MNKRQRKKQQQVGYSRIYRRLKEIKRKEHEYQVAYLRILGLLAQNTRPRQFGKAFQKEIRALEEQ